MSDFQCCTWIEGHTILPFSDILSKRELKKDSERNANFKHYTIFLGSSYIHGG